MTTRKKQVREALTLKERDAIAAFAAHVGKPWRSELIKIVNYGLYTPSGERTWLVRNESEAMLSALEKLGVAGLKTYRRPRSSMTWAKSRAKRR